MHKQRINHPEEHLKRGIINKIFKDDFPIIITSIVFPRSIPLYFTKLIHIIHLKGRIKLNFHVILDISVEI